MRTHEEMVAYHADHYGIVDFSLIKSREDYVQALIRSFAYEKSESLVEGRRVLDLGCNAGYGTSLLAKSAGTAEGVDVSERAICEAKKRNPHLCYRLIDGIKLPYPDGNFDAIVSFQVVEHIVDYKVYFGEIKRTLASNGVALFSTPNASIRLDSNQAPINPFHVREFTHRELKALLLEFFKEVAIFGLFAEEPLYSVEFDRVARARLYMRKQMLRKSPPLRSKMKKILPPSVVGIMRAIKASLSVNTRIIDGEFMQKYTRENLFYRTDNLADSLDLMAICSDDSVTLKENSVRYLN